MREECVKTIWYRIFMAGDTATAMQVCRKYCRVGLCVTVEAADYIYTGGAEAGFIVGLINYPRFPSDDDTIKSHAFALARELANECCQHSFTVMNADDTWWYSSRPGA